MSAENFPLSKHEMPQIDFGRAFETDTTTDVSSPLHFPLAVPSRAVPDGSKSPRPSAIARSHWANVAFVTVTLMGGLFCGFYFFNGAELMRAAAAWPAELLYGRPATPVFAKIDKVLPSPTVDFATAVTPPAQSDSGPFPRSAQSLLSEPAQPPAFANVAALANPATTPRFPGGIDGPAPFDNPGASIPGGDDLTRSLIDPSSATDPASDAANNPAATTALKTVAQTKRTATAVGRKVVHRVKSRVSSQKTSAQNLARAAKTTANGAVARSTTAAPVIGGARGINGAGASIGGINGNSGLGGLGGIGGIHGGGGGAGGGIGGINGGSAGAGAGGIGGITGTVRGIIGGRH